ncbi:MAG: ankyrin repeat domain-containing protein, partial [bacterium]
GNWTYVAAGNFGSKGPTYVYKTKQLAQSNNEPVLTVPNREVTKIALHPEKPRMYIGTEERGTEVWNIRTGDTVDQFREIKLPAAVAANGEYMLGARSMGGRMNQYEIISLPDQTTVHRPKWERAHVLSPSFVSPKGRFFAFAALDSRAELLSLKTPESLRKDYNQTFDLDSFLNRHLTVGNNSFPYRIYDGWSKKRVERFLEAGGKVNHVTDRRLTPLHAAVRKGNESMVGFLLNRGAEPNFASSLQKSPLMLALRKHVKPEILRLLLENGADPNRIDSNGNTPLMYAAHSATSIEPIKVLLDHGAKPGIKRPDGKTAYFYAQKNKNLPPEKVENLLKP